MDAIAVVQHVEVINSGCEASSDISVHSRESHGYSRTTILFEDQATWLDICLSASPPLPLLRLDHISQRLQQTICFRLGAVLSKTGNTARSDGKAGMYQVTWDRLSQSESRSCLATRKLTGHMDHA